MVFIVVVFKFVAFDLSCSPPQ